MSESSADELRAQADRLRTLIEEIPRDEVHAAENLKKIANSYAGSWSGSNIGYHSRVYYEGFRSPPPGRHFNAEWGLDGHLTPEQWVELDAQLVAERIRQEAGVPDVERIAEAAAAVRQRLGSILDEADNVLAALLSSGDDSYLSDLKSRLSGAWPTTLEGALRRQVPYGKPKSSDGVAVRQGFTAAPHQEVLARATVLLHAVECCGEVDRLLDLAIKYVERLARRTAVSARQTGTRVFIGHGHSSLWRELKDYIEGELKLPSDEFGRVPVAGGTITDRLNRMLDEAAMAFLILTAEDERADGTTVARQNVVHEVGLFQGRLGFSRAIVMLEEGCKAFSNIDGLEYIRFPAGDISASFHRVRRVLERERLVKPTS
ncbi:TIR domain-containing protein [Saccharothrix saharensis]|uniref:TIR domain-containing protein n=1 Tax=Saccharothrix saharensis TaxID=571190 RepID=UPI0036AC7526